MNGRASQDGPDPRLRQGVRWRGKAIPRTVEILGFQQPGRLIVADPITRRTSRIAVATLFASYRPTSYPEDRVESRAVSA